MCGIPWPGTAAGLRATAPVLARELDRLGQRRLPRRASAPLADLFLGEPEPGQARLGPAVAEFPDVGGPFVQLSASRFPGGLGEHIRIVASSAWGDLDRIFDNLRGRVPKVDDYDNELHYAWPFLNDPDDPEPSMEHGVTLTWRGPLSGDRVGDVAGAVSRVCAVLRSESVGALNEGLATFDDETAARWQTAEGLLGRGPPAVGALVALAREVVTLVAASAPVPVLREPEAERLEEELLLSAAPGGPVAEPAVQRLWPAVRGAAERSGHPETVAYARLIAAACSLAAPDPFLSGFDPRPVYAAAQDIVDALEPAWGVVLSHEGGDPLAAGHRWRSVLGVDD